MHSYKGKTTRSMRSVDHRSLGSLFTAMDPGWAVPYKISTRDQESLHVDCLSTFTMAIWKRTNKNVDNSTISLEANPVKKEYDGASTTSVPVDHEGNEHHRLHRGLKGRHITMIAIGGAIGTGLIIGT